MKPLKRAAEYSSLSAEIRARRRNKLMKYLEECQDRYRYKAERGWDVDPHEVLDVIHRVKEALR